MGFYTDVIRERDRIDRELEKDAELCLKDSRGNSGPTEAFGGACPALKLILSRYGLAAKEVHGCRNITEMLDLTLDPLGLIYDRISLSEGAWKKRSDHMLAFLEDGKAVALMPSVFGYRYVCPSTGEKRIVTDKTSLQDTAYVIQRPIEIDHVNLVSFSLYVLHLVSPRDLVWIGTATLLVSALGLVTPKLNQYVLQEVVPMGTGGYGLLLQALVLFLMAGFIRSGISAAKSLSLTRLQVRIPSEVQAAVMSRTLLLPQTFFTDTSTGKLSKQISNARVLSEQILGFVMGVSMTAVFSLVYIRQLASFSVVLLVPALAVLLARCAYTMIASYFYSENEIARQSAEMENRTFLYSSMKGIQRIKESGAEKRVYAKWTKKYRPVLASELDKPLVLKIEDAVLSFLSSLTTVLLLSLVVPFHIPKSDYIAFNACFALIATAVGEFIDAYRNILLMRPKMAQLKTILESPHEDSAEKTVLRRLRGDIRIENLDFAYDDSGFGCLKDISLHIEEGEKVAIVGESGCGKSTLLKLILGILRPVSGGIYIDNTPLGAINLRSYRRHIGSVFQFSRVMPGTIYSNIAFCNRPLSREEAREAAVRADLDETIMKLPLGYDTEISDTNTGGFSGGQRQRLMIARAFASKPGIMILDEATSALDNLSQNKVLESVYQETCTVIMVAHRLSTVRDCDRIIVLKDGRIAEEGKFDELMALEGEFYELMRRQSA